jgi:hypothetical protein
LRCLHNLVHKDQSNSADYEVKGKARDSRRGSVAEQARVTWLVYKR